MSTNTSTYHIGELIWLNLTLGAVLLGTLVTILAQRYASSCKLVQVNYLKVHHLYKLSCMRLFILFEILTNSSSVSIVANKYVFTHTTEKLGVQLQ